MERPLKSTPRLSLRPHSSISKRKCARNTSKSGSSLWYAFVAYALFIWSKQMILTRAFDCRKNQPSTSTRSSTSRAAWIASTLPASTSPTSHLDELSKAAGPPAERITLSAWPTQVFLSIAVSQSAIIAEVGIVSITRWIVFPCRSLLTNARTRSHFRSLQAGKSRA